MKEKNAYERAQLRRDKEKVIARGMCWIASKTRLVINLSNGYLMFPLRN